MEWHKLGNPERLEMKYFSMFSGIGGFELGIKRATKGKWECIGFSEIDKYAVQTYKKHFPDHKNYGDATKINPEELPDFDMLCGGFPCQSFSIAGKRMGFKDTRGTLFFEIARIIKAKKPKLVFLENVKGLLSHNGRRTFITILATLDELGYNAEWQVLNSKYFGVPQNRERVFIIGHLRGQSGRQIFPIREDGEKINGSKSGERMEQTAQCLRARDYSNWEGNFVVPKVAGCLTAGGHSGGLHSDMTAIPDIKQLNDCKESNDKQPYQQNRVYDSNGLSPALNAQLNKGNHITIKQINNPIHSNDRVYSDDGISPSLNTMQGGNRQPFIQSVIGAMRGRNPKRPTDRTVSLETEQRLELNKSGMSNCLSTVQKDNLVVSERIRRLTPVECERLQGFPDNYTFGVSDSQRYKQLGNAVTVNVIKVVINGLI